MSKLGLKLKLRPTRKQRERLNFIATEVRRMHNFVRSEQERIGKQIWSELCLQHPQWPSGAHPVFDRAACSKQCSMCELRKVWETANPGLAAALKDAAAQKKVFWTWTGSRKGKGGKPYKIFQPVFRDYLTEYREKSRGANKGQVGGVPLTYKQISERMESALKLKESEATSFDVYSLSPLRVVRGDGLGSILPIHVTFMRTYKTKMASGPERAWFGFRKASDKQSFSVQVQNDAVVRRTASSKHIFIPSLGKFQIDEDLSNNWPRYETARWCGDAKFTRTSAGEWYVSLQAEVPEANPLPKTGKFVGLDMAFKTGVLAVTSEGEELPIDDSKLERLAANIAKKRAGYDRRRYRAQKRRLAADGSLTALSDAQIQAKVVDSLRPRNNPLQRNARKIATAASKKYDRAVQYKQGLFKTIAYTLCTKYDTIAVEDLSVAGIQKSFGKSVAKRSWGEFVKILEYTAKKYAKVLVKIDRYCASTQTCSSCGAKNGPKGRKELSIRQWICKSCGASHDRDANAATNVRNEGLRILSESVEKP